MIPSENLEHVCSQVLPNGQHVEADSSDAGPSLDGSEAVPHVCNKGALG